MEHDKQAHDTKTLTSNLFQARALYYLNEINSRMEIRMHLSSSATRIMRHKLFRRNNGDNEVILPI